MEKTKIETYFEPFPLLEGFIKSWSWMTNVNHCNPFYSPLYYIICRIMRSKHILEVGCEQGYSAYMLARAAKENGGVYYCVEKSSSFANQLKGGLVEEGFPHVLIWADSKDIKEFKWAPQLDFVLLDGEHSKEAIEQEFEWVYPKLRPGSYVALHDIVAWSAEGYWDILQNPRFNFECVTFSPNYGLALFRQRREDWREFRQQESDDARTAGEPSPGWMYTGKAPPEGKVSVLSSTVPSVGVTGGA